MVGGSSNSATTRTADDATTVKQSSKASTASSPAVEGVRAFVEEHVPGDWDLEERRMFGMIMWMVRGHMFIGVSLSSQKLIVRVGEENVDPILAKHSAIGVEQCASADGARVYKGTIRVDLDAYRGEKRLQVWFDYALANNQAMAPKQSSEKPRKKRVRSSAEDGAGAEDEAEDVVEEEQDDAVAVADPLPRPASTSGGAFARCVLHVVRSIPKGKVASYGQVAALSGAPRNARQVGALLRDGLCSGGSPWHRVIGSSGRSSLPPAQGGDVQRERLMAEGVVFTPAGCVVQTAWWARVAPFYA